MAVAAIVVVEDVADAETTSNCYSTIYEEGMAEKSSLFCIFAEKDITYDPNGNLMSDVRSGISSVAYNELNLPQSVTFTGGEADYLYLSDGTKLAALKDGSGLIYCGSMVFSCSFSGTAPAVDFESTGFSAGRMVKKDGAVQPEYHVNDYLCSVRVVTDARGEVLERNDYSGFGKRLASSAGSANRYRFSGKEEQGFAGVPWQDFGARMYDPDLARWTTPDPLAEKYPGISPYVYCNSNPVNYVDPDGELPFFANFVGGFVSAGVEYGSQVIGNIVSNGFSAESFTNVDLFDIGVAFGEGFITSGTNVARRVITKAAVELTGEIARNTVDIQVGYGADHTPIVNSFGEVIVDTAIGVASDAINVDVNVSPFKGVSNTKAVRTAREAANLKGESLSSHAADGVRRQNAIVNAEKAEANQAISEGVGAMSGSTVSKVIDELQDKHRD